MADDQPLDSRLAEIQARYKSAKDHASKWRLIARQCYDFYAGEQWSEEDKQKLEAQQRPVITFNRAAVLIDAVLGYETNNRMETRYIPRTQGDAAVNEMLTNGAAYFRDQCDAEFHESDAFRDTAICGMGWTGDRLSDDDNPEFDLIRERVDPFEMYWDPSAREPNLADARYIFRKKFKASEEIRAEWPEWDGVDSIADWVNDGEFDDAPDMVGPRSSYKSDEDGMSVKRDVPVLEYQWMDKETSYIVQLPPDPETGMERPPATLTEEQYEEKKDELAKMGLRSTAQRKSVYKRCFVIGGEVMPAKDGSGKDYDTVYPKGFTYHCITGKRDRNKNWWIGIMFALIDPQRWSNKWLSQILHIINSNAKGGVMIEKQAMDNQSDFESKWADPSGITVVADGSLSRGAVVPKPPPVYPAGIDKLLEYANTSFTDVSGINQELLGMADRDQPGVLEWQRKQSAVTLLAPLFDSLRRYRKMSGRCWLYMMTKYVSDGRMVRITQEQDGMEQEMNVPFQWSGEDVSDYDVIVDQAASAPNQKEATWAVLNTMLPVIKEMLSPPIMMALLEYSPLPESLLEKLKQLAQEASQNPPPNPDEIKLQIEQQKMQMQLQIKQEELKLKQQEAQMQMEIDRQKAAQELQIEREKARVQLEVEQIKAQQQIQLAQQKGQFDRAMMHEEMGMERERFAFEREQSHHQLENKKQLGDISVQAAKNKAKAAGKPKQASA